MKILVIRLSSLGDLILSTSFLENLPIDAKVDWVISKELSFSLEGHPKISKLIVFDKKEGLSGWINLMQGLKTENYDAVIDLHRTLRSFVARFILGHAHVISKERVRTVAYLILKRSLPKMLRPSPYWKRFAGMAKIIQSEMPADLKPPSYFPLLGRHIQNENEILARYRLSKKTYFAVMPASRWRSKEWGVEKYFALIHKLHAQGLTPLILGRESDRACIELLAKLKTGQIDSKNALTEADFKNTAILLKNAKFYLGSDTGLFHLAESVGTQSFVIFGPTQKDLGFGPWKTESKPLTSNAFCSPCSKDGKICYRVTNSYACLKNIRVDDAFKEITT